MTATAEERPADEALPRRLGTPTLTLMIVAFCCPIATMAGFMQLSIGFGNGLGAPTSFLVAGGVLLLFTVGFVGMSKHISHPGPFYRYIIEGLGRPAGLAGSFLATAAYILIAAGSYVYMGLVAMDVAERLTGGPLMSWQAWTVLFLGLIVLLGLLRIDLSMKVLGTLVLVEVVVVTIWQVAVFTQGGPEGYDTSSFTPGEFFSGNVGIGVLFAMLTMTGVEVAACFRDEARDPDRSVARATYIAIGFSTVFYALGTWAYILTQGPSNAIASAQNDPVGSFLTSVDDYIGVFFLNLFAIILVTSQMAASNALLGAGSRYLHALGTDGVLWRGLARVHPRLQSPHVAILAVTVPCVVFLAAIFAFDVDPVLAYGAGTGIGIYFLLPLLIATSAAVIVFYRRRPELSAGPWSSVIAPALAMVALAALFVFTTKDISVLVPDATLGVVAQIGLVAVALFGFLLAMHYKRNRPEVYETIGRQ